MLQQQLALGDMETATTIYQTIETIHLLTKFNRIMINKYFDNYTASATTTVPIYLHSASASAIQPQQSYLSSQAPAYYNQISQMACTASLRCLFRVNHCSLNLLLMVALAVCPKAIPLCWLLVYIHILKANSMPTQQVFKIEVFLERVIRQQSPSTSQSNTNMTWSIFRN